MEHGTPAILHVGYVQGWNDGSLGASLELFFAGSIPSAVGRSELEEASGHFVVPEVGGNIAVLEDTLDVETQVPAVIEETDSCGVRIEGVDVDFAVLRGIAEESCIVVRVRDIAACLGEIANERAAAIVSRFFFILSDF